MRGALIDETTRRGRSLRTIGRLTSSVDLLMAAYRSHQRDNRQRAGEFVDICDRLVELADGVRAELEES